MTPQNANGKYKLFLILPGQKYVNYYGQTELSRMLGKKKFMIPLAVPMIAAITPPEFEVRIIDEELEKIPRREMPDIVGISALASTVTRAYELCDFYRSRGVKTVIGGPYVSFMTDEALQHADTVVAGEAEGLWQQCLSDFKAGTMQKVYRAIDPCSFEEIPPPRWDLIDMRKVFQVGMQVSRGCPYKCEFCLVTKLFGNKMRYRSVQNVVDEIRSLPVRKVLFVDDNLTANKRYTRELMQALRPLGISWGCMASIEIARDPGLLTEMRDAGCFNILLGFESLNADSLFETHKKQNKDALIYEEAVKTIHGLGIHITASFVIGFDNDTPADFERIYEFTQRTGLSFINFNILGAPPGTELYYRLKSEGRIYEINPDLISGLFPCMHYNKMSQTELFTGYMQTLQKMYSWESVYAKAKVLFGPGTFIYRYNDGPPGVWFRFVTVFRLLGEFLFTRSRYKRKLFLYIISMIRSGRTAIDMGLAYLLSMISYQRHIRKMQKDMPRYLDMIARYDKGPWEKMKESQSST